MSALSEMNERRFAAKSAAIAEGLREMANRVEREAASPDNRVGSPVWGWRAEQVVHTVMWGVANLDLSGLVGVAAEADRDVFVPLPEPAPEPL